MKPRIVELKLSGFSPEESTVQMVKWLVDVGEPEEIDQDIAVLKIAAAEFIFPSPMDGIIREILVEPEEIIEMEQALAIVELI